MIGRLCPGPKPGIAAFLSGVGGPSSALDVDLQLHLSFPTFQRAKSSSDVMGTTQGAASEVMGSVRTGLCNLPPVLRPGWNGLGQDAG